MLAASLKRAFQRAFDSKEEARVKLGDVSNVTHEKCPPPTFSTALHAPFQQVQYKQGFTLVMRHKRKRRKDSAGSDVTASMI